MSQNHASHLAGADCRTLLKHDIQLAGLDLFANLVESLILALAARSCINANSILVAADTYRMDTELAQVFSADLAFRFAQRRRIWG